MLLEEYQNGTTHKKRQSCNCTSIDSEGRGYGQDNVYCYQCLSFWKTLILIVKATKVGRAWVWGPVTVTTQAECLLRFSKQIKKIFLISLWLLGTALLHDCRLSIEDMMGSQVRMNLDQ